MSVEINVYCDESCHLEHDRMRSMVLGAVSCPQARRKEISVRLKEIKAKHKLTPKFEMKWTKVGQRKLEYYMEVLDFFFDDDDLHFRGLVVPNKDKLDHKAFESDHDTWYYKMFFTMLKTIFEPEYKYRIFVDIKDTRGADKVLQLHDVLCNNAYDFSRKMIADVKQIRSHESEQMQLADLLVGALGYLHRGNGESASKVQLINRIKSRSKYSLERNTLLREKKFNLLIWQPGVVG